MLDESRRVGSHVVLEGVSAQHRIAQRIGYKMTRRVLRLTPSRFIHRIHSDREVAEVGNVQLLLGNRQVVVVVVQLQRADAIAVATLLIQHDVILFLTLSLLTHPQHVHVEDPEVVLNETPIVRRWRGRQRNHLLRLEAVVDQTLRLVLLLLLRQKSERVVLVHQKHFKGVRLRRPDNDEEVLNVLQVDLLVLVATHEERRLLKKAAQRVHLRVRFGRGEEHHVALGVSRLGRAYRVVGPLHVAVVEVGRLLEDQRVVRDGRAEHVSIAGSEAISPHLHPVRSHEAVGDGVVDLARGGVVDAEREGVHVPLDDLNLVGGEVLHVQVV